MTKTLRQVFNGTIWNIEVDEEMNVIALETRNVPNHTASFSAFNFETGESFFNEVTVKNSWWHGLDKAYGGLVLLHGYRNEASPERKGIIALDFSGRIKWQQFNMALDSVDTAGLLAYNSLIQPKKLVRLSAETGQQMDNHSESKQPLENSITVPHVYDPLLRPAFISINVEGMIFTSSYHDLTILAFHTKSDGLYDQHLLVEKAGEIVFADKISTAIQKLNPEAFFLLRGFLFYIRNKNEIVSYSL